MLKLIQNNNILLSYKIITTTFTTQNKNTWKILKKFKPFKAYLRLKGYKLTTISPQALILEI